MTTLFVYAEPIGNLIADADAEKLGVWQVVFGDVPPEALADAALDAFGAKVTFESPQSIGLSVFDEAEQRIDPRGDAPGAWTHVAEDVVFIGEVAQRLTVATSEPSVGP